MIVVFRSRSLFHSTSVGMVTDSESFSRVVSIQTLGGGGEVGSREGLQRVKKKKRKKKKAIPFLALGVATRYVYVTNIKRRR